MSLRTRNVTALAACLVLALSSVASMPAGAATGSAESQQYLRDARQALKKGDAKSALIQLKNAVKADPSNAEARYELGLLHFQLADLASAEKELRQANERQFAPAKVLPLLGAVYLAEGKGHQVLGEIKPCPDDKECAANVLALRARARLAMNKADEAETEARQAVDVDPSSPAAHMALALVLQAKGDYAEAETLINQALSAAPKSAEALAVKGDLRRVVGDIDGAVSAYRASIQSYPRNLSVRLRLALMLIGQDKDADANAEVDTALKQDPQNVMGQYLRAMLLTRAGKFPQALDTIRPIEAHVGAFPNGHYLLAVIHASNNNLEQALANAAKFHAANLDSIPAAKLLGTLQFRRGEYEKVIATLSPLKAKLASDAGALDILGSAYLASGRVAEANALLSQAVKLSPDDMTRARLAFTRVQQAGTREEGIRELEAIIEKDSKNKQIDLVLVMSYIGNGDYDRALAAAKSMASRMPDSAMPLTLIGATYLIKGDEAEARQSFSAAWAKDPSFVPAALNLVQMDVHSGDMASARRYLDEILKREPDELRALMALSDLYLTQNNQPAAIETLNQAVKAHPTEFGPRMALINLLTATGDLAKAQAVAADMLRGQPDSILALDVNGRTLLALGQRDDALATYKKITELAPANAQAHLRYGQVLAQLDKFPEAKAAVDKALVLDPLLLVAWQTRVALEFRTGGYYGALKIAEKARNQNPDNPMGQLLVADVHAENKHPAEAEEIYRKQMAKAPTAEVLLRLYRVVRLKGPEAGRKVLTEWLEKNPTDSVVRLAYADDLLASNDLKAAAEQYERLAKETPADAAIFNNLAWVYSRLGDPRALETARTAYRLASNIAEVADTYGWMLYVSSQAKQGADLVRQAYLANPRNPSIVYHMAKVLADAKDVAGAQKTIKPVIDANVRFDEADDARQLYKQVGGG